MDNFRKMIDTTTDMEYKASLESAYAKAIKLGFTSYDAYEAYLENAKENRRNVLEAHNGLDNE